MSKTSRRDLLRVAAVGSVAAGVGLTTKVETAAAETEAAGAAQTEAAGAQEHQLLLGLLAHATVSFGQWQTDPPLDRFPNESPPAGLHHQQIPRRVIIRAGGSVSFIITGLQQVIVYGPGTRPTDIDVDDVVLSTGMPPGVPLINDPNNRVYRGPDPSLHPRDRVEVVHFPHRGTYLVISGVHPHFVDQGMFGFVSVLP